MRHENVSKGKGRGAGGRVGGGGGGGGGGNRWRMTITYHQPTCSSCGVNVLDVAVLFGVR